ncbi:hypothetical protein AB3X96_10515 [Paraburkholderia sp. BR13439]|uniref:hypothetical protein n=1 Tax=Paraburkholderia sp. BR13439 TaxID=3236996 RepID=UPI0034CE25C4
MQLSKVRYPHLTVKHRHVAKWMTRNWLYNYHVRALRTTVYPAKPRSDERRAVIFRVRLVRNPQSSRFNRAPRVLRTSALARWPGVILQVSYGVGFVPCHFNQTLNMGEPDIYRQSMGKSIINIEFDQNLQLGSPFLLLRMQSQNKKRAFIG